MKSTFAIVKRLLASNKISFIITALVVLCATSSGDVVLSNGNYTWLLAVMTPFFFVFYAYTKLMHLGASKRDYFFGCLISYGILALSISLINTLIHLLIDPVYPARTVINMMDVCNWTENGIFIAGVQQLFFLLLVMIFLHVLLSMQSHWYGWLTDAILVAIICVFTPIAVLREILSGFFQMIMLNSNAMVNASNKEWTDYIGGKPSAEDRKIVLQVPTALLDTVILSTTNEDVFLPVLAVTGSIDVSTNGGNITFENLDVGNTLTLTVKNGDISGTVAGSYDDFAIQSEIKKGDSNLPNNKESGKKMLNVTSNNGDINIEFLNK